MATKKRGLGKGLDALFVDNAVESESRVNTLPIAEVEAMIARDEIRDAKTIVAMYRARLKGLL